MVAAIDEQIAKGIIWLLYFVGLYFSLFWLSVLLFRPEPNIKKNIKIWPRVSIIMPMWNEEENIGPTIESLQNLDYPKDKLTLIVVDDGSTDNSYSIAKKLQKKYGFKLLKQKNGGKHTAVNNGLTYVTSEFFACLDVDGYVDSQAMKHIMREFTTKRVAAVMPVMKVAQTNTMLQKVQWFEYILNIFLKYVIGKLHCIHVTPGPLSTYRTHIVKELGCFKKAHKTEDLEIALRLQDNHYILKQSIDAVIYTKCPKTLSGFISQRTRWYQGTLMNIIDYRHFLFNKKYGDFGFFYMPLVAFTGFLGFLGVLTISYLFLKEIYHMVKRWFLTGFDFTTYLSSWSFEFYFLDLNYQTLFTSSVLLVLIYVYMYLSFYSVGEKTGILRNFSSTLMFIYYFFVYKFLIAYIWLKVFYRVLKNKEVVWDDMSKVQ